MPNWVQIRPPGGVSAQMNERQQILFIYTLFGNTDPSTDIALEDQNDADLRDDVPFGVSLILKPV